MQTAKATKNTISFTDKHGHTYTSPVVERKGGLALQHPLGLLPQKERGQRIILHEATGACIDGGIRFRTKKLAIVFRNALLALRPDWSDVTLEGTLSEELRAGISYAYNHCRKH